MLSRPQSQIGLSQGGSEAHAVAALPAAGETASRKNMNLLIQLRWIAAAGQILTIAFVRLKLGIALPMASMSVVVASLLVLNIASVAWLRRGTEISNRGLLTVLILDVAALTAQLYLSGGATNPFTSLYLLQITLAAVLLDVVSAWAIVAIACVSFAALTEVYQPLALPLDRAGDLFSLYITGMLVGFALDAGLLVVFVTRITKNLRERDARLAALKQLAAEEDHIVRMGLLASGAAHELGTPLSSLAVILADWKRVHTVDPNSNMAQEIEEMQAAVQRCKSSLTGVLLSAGEVRGEAPRVTSVHAFLGELVGEWRAARSATTLVFENEFGPDIPIVSDSALKQVIFNVLDNAYEVSPGWVKFIALRDGGSLVLRVRDLGPGFAPEMLAKFGKPYQSTKGRLGGGLGLFLVVNVVRKLGGFVAAVNRERGGVEVSLNLPLAALALGVREHDE